MGNLKLVRLRPFSSNRVDIIGDAINVAARLVNEAGPSEIVTSNGFYQRVDAEARHLIHELPPVEGKNIGLVRCWKLAFGVGGRP